jgi:hypothetical protein
LESNYHALAQQLSESEIKAQQAVYAVPGVNEEEDVQEARKRKKAEEVVNSSPLVEAVFDP